MIVPQGCTFGEISLFPRQRVDTVPDNADVSNLFLARFFLQLIELSGHLFGLISESGRRSASTGKQSQVGRCRRTAGPYGKSTERLIQIILSQLSTFTVLSKSLE